MPRPTLLIGFGGYGLDVLQRLLHQSALRGVLRWQEARSGGVASARRRLQDLALLALPDPLESTAPGAVPPAAGAPQFLTDLYRQIQGPATAARLEVAEIARQVRELADGLVSHTAFDRRDPVGLDLILLARPGAPDTIPQLDTLLQHCLETLADSSFFQRAVQGAGNLNAILILDFDDYWLGTGAPAAIATARALRAALRNSMQVWERRQAERLVALDRCYLLDGRTAIGYRPPQVRLDEAVLFLELLLFEGLRTQRQGLYQQQSLLQPITATFGVRLLEEGTSVLSREAAATFGRRWLDALLGDQVRCPDRAARHLRETLATCNREAIERHLEEGHLGQVFAEGAEQMVASLMTVPDPQAADWLDRVRTLFESEGRALGQALERAGWEPVRAFKERQLKDLEQRLSAAVDADLHDERAPVSLMQVRAALAEVRQGLDASPEPPTVSPPAIADPLLRLGQMQRRYRAQLDEWLTDQGRLLHRFWPPFALLLALGLAAPSVRFIDRLALPGLDGWDTLIAAVRAANHPLSWTLCWLLCLWGVLALRVQPLITHRIVRAQRFYSDTQRGRFQDHLRGLVEPWRDSLLARVQHNRRASLVNDVRKTLGRIDDRLAERAREMDWLRRQLNEFLRLSTQPAMAVRHWVHRGQTRETLMQPRPLERICDPQDDLPRPFAGWQQRYCDAFLDPLAFIERLSRTYADADEAALERHRRGPDGAAEDPPERRRALLDFIDNAQLAPACRFLQDTGVPEERRWCIGAQRWRAITGLQDALAHRLGINPDDSIPAADRSRLYLLVVQSGIAADTLERGEP